MARICFPSFLILCQIFLNFHLADSKETTQNGECKDFTCGFLGTVGFPFCESPRPDCGLIKLDCAANNSRPKLDLVGKKYEVVEKDGNFLRVVDRGLERLLKNSSCETFYRNLSLPDSPVISYDVYHFLTLFRCDLGSDKSGLGDLGSYNKCSGFEVFYKENPYEDLVNYGYVVYRDTPAGCSRIELPIPLSTEHRPHGDGPFGLLNASILLEWRVSGDCYECRDRGGRCIVDERNRYRCSKGKVNFRLLLRAVIPACVVGILIFAILIFYFRRKYICGYIIWNLIRPKSNDEQMLENFLANYGSFAPKRYSYSELRKMTESFRNQLGQGGFGCVYKGKMHNGSLVAVKVLKDLKDGEGFINEVASISRTSHVNIVSLNGFCFDGRKRALVYEFMSNGSLEKFIYENKSSTRRQLGWKVLYNIAIGIARGLEYLHRGCNTRILHFDIKPHNILLDENFCPKISDFGLAKLCVNKESTVSIVGARGTIGYIAPEVVCRSIGGISYKSDVYSYGMMVLEMVGGRKNVDVGVSRASEIYFPHWIHSQLQLDESLELTGITNEEENEYARKMVIVSLWCIQMDPAIRPSMSKIVEMLEGNLSNLEIPPKPCFSSPSTSEVSYVRQSHNDTSPLTSDLA